MQGLRRADILGRMYKSLLALIVVAAHTDATLHAQLGEDLSGRFHLSEGLGVTLWAESPQLYNPTAIDVDAQGRLWVAEAVNYRRWDGRNPGRSHEGGDRIVVLEDTDGDGVCDRSSVFVQDPDLTAPLGICVLGDEVIVSCSPNVFVYRDSDRDGEADERRTVLTGFGGFDHDHGVHSVVVGPDGGLWLTVGNAGPHVVTDAGGWTLRSGSMYTGSSPYNSVNTPGLVSDDGRVWVGGLVLRLDSDWTGLEVYAHNFRNQYEVALDSFGNPFTEDNDDDGNGACRTTWVMRGGNYGFFSADGSRSWQADRRPGQDNPTAHWHQDDPGVAPAGTMNGPGGPTGVCVYEASGPDDAMRELDGAVLNADAGAGVVYAHRPRRDRRAGIELEKGVLIGRTGSSGRSADDGRGTWFRPSDVVVGIDGSIFVSDWYDPGVGGHAAGDREAYGRILRIAPKGVQLASVPLDDPITALTSPALNPRAEALGRIEASDDPALVERLQKLARHPSPRIAARALWPLAKKGAQGRAFVEGVMTSGSPEMQVAAFRALDRAGIDLVPMLMTLVDEAPHSVLVEVAFALRDLPRESCTDVLFALTRRYYGSRYYLEALGMGAEGKEQWLYDQLQSLTGGDLFQIRKHADIAWRLHPEGAVEDFFVHAMRETNPPEMRRRMLDALAFIPTREAAGRMLDAALAGPTDLRSYALWWVRHRSHNDWREFDLAAQLPGRELEGSTLRWSSGTRSEGLVEVDVDVAGSSTLWLVVTDTGNGMSCDWADWIEPRFVTDGGEVRLSELGWVQASAGWGSVQMGRNCEGGLLAVGDMAFTDGIGTHAHSEIAFRVPADAQRFVCRVGPDLGGTIQGCGTSIGFEVYTDAPEDRGELLALQAAALDESLEDSQRPVAVRALASDPEGGLFLIRLAERGELQGELAAVAAGAIFSNPDLGVRALASAHFRRPEARGEGLPPVSELAAMEGDPVRGARVFFGQKALCSSCHVFGGRGADVGPDLTRIRTKYGAPELLDAILNPDVAIALGYETYLFETVDGVLHAGFLLADGEDVLIKDTQGRRHVIPADEIAERHYQERSTMPRGVAMGLDAREIADLLALLMEDPDRATRYGEEIALFDGESLSGWTWHLSKPDVPPEQVWSVADGVLRCEGRPVGYLRTEADHESYELTLEWRFDPERGPGNSGVLLRMVGEDKVWPKSMEAQLHSRNAGDIWNIDRFPMDVDAGRTSGRRTVKLNPTNELPLGEWNRYRITLDGGSLTIEVNGLVQNTARWCEVVPGKICLQSEGAYIEFRNIRLRPILD